ncbi:unnamed protein product [Cyclocybe aegerita]|uniref:F-box domain-containing protein n=1 Tax=Cyclocybe aegerita TaxID=1973307 RepID=A0A8S0VY90_CYCAE|nr:unnamed protein product [Cyclocybe aegerita]
MNDPHLLSTVPQEVLEHIAFAAATDTSGLLSNIVPLLLTSRHVHGCLSITTNPHLYARIFCAKFDTAAARVSFASSSDQLTSYALASELQRRCTVLQRIKARTDSTKRARRAAQAEDKEDLSLTVHDVLSTAYIMMLEDEGRNRTLLVDYAGMKNWLREFWFDPDGASLAIHSIRTGHWPPNRPETALGMWLFWFLLYTDDYPFSVIDGPEAPVNVLKIMALGAHIYNLTTTTWSQFEPNFAARKTVPPESTILYGTTIELTPPPLATAAILSFLALVNKRRSIPLPPSNVPRPRHPEWEWDTEWGKCFVKPRRDLTECFRPGSIEGVWEGFFLYSEFTAYAALLAGAPPVILQKSAVGKHQQTWKLREHHLLAADDDTSGSDSGIELDRYDVRQGKSTEAGMTPLRAGDPLRSYFPTGAQIREGRDGLVVQESSDSNARVLRYQRASCAERKRNVGVEVLEEEQSRKVVDIIITGEGHSAWGQFNLVGRIRPCDGFISLSKDYVDGDRGKWLYRGYLVGNTNGNLAGRWRDTLSPAEVPGYEGCFVMSRRR